MVLTSTERSRHGNDNKVNGSIYTSYTHDDTENKMPFF